MNVDVQKKRLFRMFAINGLCLVLGDLALFGYIRTGEVWAIAGLVAAFAAAFATQIWFIAGVAKAGRAQ